MVNRLVSVGDDFTLPPAVKAADANLPARLSAAELANTYAPLSGSGDYLSAAALLEGADLTIYGHSYTPVPGFYTTPGNEWPSLLADRYGMVQTNHGESGARMIEMAAAAIGPSFPGFGDDRAYPAGKPGVIVLECEQNDTLFGPNTAKGQAGFKHALRAFLATVTAGQRIESQQGAQLPAPWTNFNAGAASGGSMLYSMTDGASLEWSGISSPTGKVHVLTIANQGPTDHSTWDVLVDGVSQGIAYTGAEQMEGFTSFTDGGASYTFSPAVVTVNIPTTGTHTVKIVNTVNNGYGIFVDSLIIPSAAPPEVVVCLDPPVNNPPTSAENAAAYVAWSPVFNQHIKDVVAEFGKNVSWVDLAPGWDSMTMAATNDTNRFHPNDAGMALIESNIAPAVVKGLVAIMPVPGIR